MGQSIRDKLGAERRAGISWCGGEPASVLGELTALCRQQDGLSLLIQLLPGWLLALLVPPEWELLKQQRLPAVGGSIPGGMLAAGDRVPVESPEDRGGFSSSVPSLSNYGFVTPFLFTAHTFLKKLKYHRHVTLY